MSLWTTFTNLSPRTRLTVGLAVLAWGTIGLYVSDVAEKKLGFEPSEEEKRALNAALPKIRAVEREGGGRREEQELRIED